MFFSRARCLNRFSIAALILFSVASLSYVGGIRVNLDNSVDGLFWRISKPNPQRNSYVVVCFPESFVARHALDRHFPGWGRCGGILPLLKQVVAIENDTFEIDDRGIFVNGVAIAHSRPVEKLQRIVDGKRKVPQNKIIIAGQTNNSLDSRYFGLVDFKWIESSAAPLF